MSRPNNAIEILLADLAPDEDAGWQWIRKLHELGYSLSGNMPCVFFRGAEYVAYEMRKGAIVWRAGYQTATKAEVVFPDPIAAAVWWETERQNLAPVVAQQPATVIPPPPPLPPFIPAPTMPSWPDDDAVRRAILDGLPSVGYPNGTSGEP
jgi:hypothetical protein